MANGAQDAVRLAHALGHSAFAGVYTAGQSSVHARRVATGPTGRPNTRS